MKKTREFNKWLNTMKSNISDWKFYTDFEKAYANVDSIKVELHILNSLVGSKNIESEFCDLVRRFPTVLKAVPILIAKREMDIRILDCGHEYMFNFENQNYSLQDYVKFMKNTGLFNLLEHHILSNLCDYVLGVEVGMDTNGRKNRTGSAMENLVESYLKKSGLIENQTYFKQMNLTEVETKFNFDLSSISNEGKTQKRFDFVIKGPLNIIYAIETNFYGSSGSKLNETARSYKNLTIEAKNIPGFEFVWITDGIGWRTAKHNLEETFDVLPMLFNINDLEHGAIDELLDIDNVINFDR